MQNTFKALTLGIGLTAILAGSGCSHRSPFEPKDGPPKLHKDISAVQDAVPKHEPRARYGNHSPYEVFGKTYHVMPSSDGYLEKGVASWYGEKFSTRPTSSMEPYDPYLMTAAHKSLPLPTYVRVTNLENQRSVIVRVNDRGPFHGDRIIDLSYAAAIKLGYANKGTAKVVVEALDPDQFHAEAAAAKNNLPAPVAVTTTEPQTSNQLAAVDQPSLYLQAGAFSKIESAERLRNQLQVILNAGIEIREEQKGTQRLHRVYVGPFQSERNALAAQSVIRDTELANPLLVKR